MLNNYMTTYEFYKKEYETKLTKRIYTQPYYTELLELTNFLPADSHYTERIYCLLNNIKERPKCEHCGENVKFPHHFRKIERFYRRFCSTTCSNNNENVQKEKSKTCIKNYGVDNPSKSVSVHQKKVDTIMDNHGGFAMQSPTLSKIIKETNTIRYGHATPSKCQKIRNKIKHSHSKRSKDDKKISSSKRKSTMLIKYGIDHNPINHYSKIAVKYIDHFIKSNNIDPKLCLFGDSEFFIRSSNKIYFYDLVVFKSAYGLHNKLYDDISIILEYDGKFWHPSIDQSITYRDTPMVLQGMTYREKFLYDKRKELVAKKILNANGGTFMRYKENQTVRILP